MGQGGALLVERPLPAQRERERERERKRGKPDKIVHNESGTRTHDIVLKRAANEMAAFSNSPVLNCAFPKAILSRPTHFCLRIGENLFSKISFLRAT